MRPVELRRGSSPVILGIPHAGVFVPEDIWAKVSDVGRELIDTDWHVDRLYEGLRSDVTTVKANFHRYVIDANRDPSGQSLYPGQNTTALCPTTDFDNRPLYRAGQEPDAEAIEARRRTWHEPYHRALAQEIARIHEQHGIAVVFDCHSIRSVLPFLFSGTLPDFNVGTNCGQTCSPSIERAVLGAIGRAEGYTSVVNGRFRGGWTTRHYGRPAHGVHAIQLELAQSTYLSEEQAPFTFDSSKARRLRPHLKAIMTALIAAVPSIASGAHDD